MERNEKMWRLVSGVGAVLLAAGVLAGQLVQGALVASLIMTLAGAGGLVAGLALRQQGGETLFDERDVLNRLKSSRFSLAITAAALVGYQVYSSLILNEVRWDLLVLFAILAVSKLGAMMVLNLRG